MLDVQHLVVQNIFDYESWDGSTVERAADDYRAMDVVVVAKNAPRLALAPGKKWTLKLSAEVPSIQF